jgi:hypothetical protein
MALDPSIALGVRPLQLPDPLAQMAQVSQIQASQRQNEMAQMQLEQLKQDRLEMKDFQSQLEKSGGNPNLDLLAKTMLKSPKYFQQGVELTKKLKEQADFERVGKSLYPELFGAAPTAAPTAAPAPSMMRQPVAAPVAPTQDMLGTGMYGMQPTNALAPNVPQAAPVNALAASVAPTEPTGKTADQLRREIIMFSQSGDPRAKAMTEMLKAQLIEVSKTAPDATLMKQLGYPLTKAGYQAFRDAQRPDRLLTPEEEAQKLRIAAASRAPGTIVNVSTEKKYGERFGGLIADADAAKLSAAEGAPSAAANADRIMDLLATGNVITGTGANVRLQMAKALNLAGGNDAEKIRNTEVLVSSLAETTLGAIKSSNLGAGQGFTNADRDFLEKAKAGQLTYDAKSLAELARLSRKAAEKSAESWNTRVKKIPASALEGTGISTEPVVVPPRKVSSVMNIPAGAIEMLKSGAGTREQFDAQFGPGSADRVLPKGR